MTQDVQAEHLALLKEPWEWRKALRRANLPASGLRVGLALIDEFANRESGACFPSYEATGIDLVADPDLAMEMDVAVKILFDGMERGSFTTKGFNDFIDDLDESNDLDLAEYRAARKIINGTDKADPIAGYALTFEAALREAGYQEKAVAGVPSQGQR